MLFSSAIERHDAAAAIARHDICLRPRQQRSRAARRLRDAALPQPAPPLLSSFFTHTPLCYAEPPPYIFFEFAFFAAATPFDFTPHAVPLLPPAVSMPLCCRPLYAARHASYYAVFATPAAAEFRC